jgi:hypothetical protein
LDRVIGDSFPSLDSAAEVKALEGVPYLERIAAASTFDAIKLVPCITRMHRQFSSYRMLVLRTRLS